MTDVTRVVALAEGDLEGGVSTRQGQGTFWGGGYMCKHITTMH